jgi:dienelactone hydrolase
MRPVRANNRPMRIILALVLSAFACPLFAADETASYGRLPSVTDMAISPDGERVAVVRTQGNIHQLLITAVEGMMPLAVVNLGEVASPNIQWADADHVLMAVRTNDGGVDFRPGSWQAMRLNIYDLVANKVSDAFAADQAFKTVNMLVGRPRIRRADGVAHLLLPGYYILDGRFLPALFRTRWSLPTQVIERGSADLRSWVFDASDNIVASDSFAATSGTWILRARHGDQLEEVNRQKVEADVPNIWGISPDGDSVWVSAIEGDARVARAISLINGAASERLPGIGEQDWPIIDRYSDRVIGTGSYADGFQYHFLAARVQKAWETVLAAFPGQSVQMLSYSDDFTRWAIRVQNEVTGPMYVLADLRKGAVARFGVLYEGIQGVAPVRAFHYKAADGLDIPAYLTVPRGRDAKGLPLVVLDYLGPGARNRLEFDTWSQALAERGYAVLRANHRGAALGLAFEKAGFGEWGRKIQSDLADGVASLAADGTIDPKRVCIMGIGFGGYSALAGVTLAQGAYQCALSLGGVSDLRRLRENWYGTTANVTPGTRFFDRLVGGNGNNDLSLDQTSPYRHVADLKVPVLLVHMRRDPYVPYEQSLMMFEALKKAGRKPVLLTLEVGDAKASDWQAMMKSVFEFLREHNPAD